MIKLALWKKQNLLEKAETFQSSPFIRYSVTTGVQYCTFGNPSFGVIKFNSLVSLLTTVDASDVASWVDVSGVAGVVGSTSVKLNEWLL